MNNPWAHGTRVTLSFVLTSTMKDEFFIWTCPYVVRQKKQLLQRLDLKKTKGTRRKKLTFPLRVTAIPSVWFSLILKVAMGFFAFVFTGLCPVISAMSFIAASRPLLFCAASPIPQLTTILLTFGTYNISYGKWKQVNKRLLESLKSKCIRWKSRVVVSVKTSSMWKVW